MKTIREWLNTLPLKYKIRALNNVRRSSKEMKADSLHKAVDLGIYWINTPEGHNFWDKVHDAIEYNDELPPIPHSKQE